MSNDNSFDGTDFLKMFRRTRQRRDASPPRTSNDQEQAFEQARNLVERHDIDRVNPFHQDEKLHLNDVEDFGQDVIGFDQEWYEQPHRDFQGLTIETLPQKRDGDDAVDVLAFDNNIDHYLQQVAALAFGPYEDEKTDEAGGYEQAPGLHFGEPDNPDYYRGFTRFVQYSHAYRAHELRLLMLLSGQAYDLCDEAGIDQARDRVMGWGPMLAMHGLRQPEAYRDRLREVVEEQGRYGGDIEQCWPHLIANEIAQRTARKNRQALNNLLDNTQMRSAEDLIDRRSKQKQIAEQLS